jgi:hypothetical protein
MEKLKDKIHGTDWETLVIFDSFRYDYFTDEYKKFPYINKESVKKVESPGSATPEAAPKLFPEKYNYNLYSANSVVHTKGFIDGWDAENSFNNISKIKSSAHNETRFTPSPQDEINFIKNNKDIINEEKSVLWLMQPHTPYFGDVQLNITDDGIDNEKIKDSNGAIQDGVKYLFRRSYRGNVREALWIATAVIGELEGKVAITSDHGELLFDRTAQGADSLRGRRGGLGHYSGSLHSKLKSVPWIKVNATNHKSIYEMDVERFVELAFECVLNRRLDEDARKHYPERIRRHENGEGTGLTMPHSRKDLILMLLRANGKGKGLPEPRESNSNIPEKQLKELGYL